MEVGESDRGEKIHREVKDIREGKEGDMEMMGEWEEKRCYGGCCSPFFVAVNHLNMNSKVS